MTELRFNDGLRHAVRTLFELSAMRAEAEERIKGEYESARERIEATHRAELEQTAQSRERGMSLVQREYADRVREAERRANEDLKSALQQYQTERLHITEKADRNREEATRGMQEAIWVAESVYEANEHQPQEKFDQTRKLLEGSLKELSSIEESMAAHVRRCRVGRALDAGKRLGAIADVFPEALKDDYVELTAQSSEQLDRLRGLRSLRWFIGIRPWVVPVVPMVAGGAGAYFATQGTVVPWLLAGIGGGLAAALAGLWLLHRFAMRVAREHCARIVSMGASARSANARRLEEAGTARDEQQQLLRETRDREVREAREQFEPILNKVAERREHHLGRIEHQFNSRKGRIQQARTQALEEAKSRQESSTGEIEGTHSRQLTEIEARYSRERAANEQSYRRQWEELEKSWFSGMSRTNEELSRLVGQSAKFLPAWGDASWESWAPPRKFSPIVRFGAMHLDRRQVPGGLPRDERLFSEDPVEYDLPAALEFPDACSLLLQAGGEGRSEAVGTLQAVMLRLLTALPPGKVRFTIFDPVGLGESFAGFMHLADYEDAFIVDKIWTETRHIEQKLVDLTEHMENVIQKYLRNEFATIDEYNEQAGEIAEPYRFLVIADLPVNFSDTAARRLASVVNSGPRCGVYTLIHHDVRQALPRGFEIEDLRKACVALEWSDGRFAWRDDDFGKFPLELDAPPDEEFITRVLHKVGAGATEAGRVEVPFDLITPDEGHLWSQNTAVDVRVPLGRAGATKLQNMTLGRGTSQHVLIAGKTGSGKSTLLHAIITNLALHYSPIEVQFYLIDFKKGVEFKPYATHQLPHARAVAIESDREFGLSVLQRIDAELKHRGDRFRELGVQDLAGFREVDHGQAMPRILLIVDEFQELFIEDDKLAQDCSLLLDRLVRQGRAFGIHVILGSQTLGGAYSLNRSTMGQMAVRIALQCSESDAYVIMSDDNAAARLLSRPGEAIYNDQSGLVEGNSPFQVAWLPDEAREAYLKRVHKLALERNMLPREPQIVFEGNIPADVERNYLLREAIEGRAPSETPMTSTAWLGDAIAIKDPTAAVFQRHSGGNLIVVGQHDEAALAMLAVSFISLAAQQPVIVDGSIGARFFVLDGTPPDAPTANYWKRLGDLVPHEVQHVAYREVADALQLIGQEVAARQEANASDRPAVFLFVHGLQRYRMLRPVEDFSFSTSEEGKPAAPDKLLGVILRDGPAVGVHTVAWCDTANNVSRSLERQALREFELRVLFQMSPTDSAALIDSPLAGKLGFRRALFYSEEQGTLEKFRPYALPPEPWLVEVGRRLRERHGRIPA